MNPLDLSGPDFLAFWIVGGAGLIITIKVAIAISQRLQRTDDLDALAARLSPSELAYLEGGVERAVETAIVGLSHRGAVRSLARTLSLNAPVDEVSEAEAHVLDTLRGGRHFIGDIIESAHGVGRVLRERLLREDLVTRSTNTGPRLLAATWIALGVAKICVGLSRHRPVGFLTMLVIASLFALPLVRLPRRTYRGDRVLKLRTAAAGGLRHTAMSAPELLTADELALAFALFGAGGVAGAIIGLLPSHARMVAAAQAAASSESSCSSGGCGGGGCGGGCGGCS